MCDKEHVAITIESSDLTLTTGRNLRFVRTCYLIPIISSLGFDHSWASLTRHQSPIIINQLPKSWLIRADYWWWIIVIVNNG